MATPPKPGKPVDPVKTLKKLLRQLRNDDADERPAVLTGLTALFDAQPDAITAADDLEMLVYAAQRGNLPVVELLLARGADPTRKPGEDDPPLLAELISIRTDDPAHLEALITGLVARGLDPNERSGRTSALDCAVEAGLSATETILRLGADQDAAIAALHVAVPIAIRDPGRAAILTRLLAHLGDVDRIGPDGLSALHILAIRGTPELLAPVLAASHNTAAPIAVTQHFNTEHCSPPGGGLVPQVLFNAGCTARDAVSALLDIHDAAVAWYGDAGFGADQRRQRRDQLAAVLALLVAHGVPHGTQTRGELPPFVTEIDALLTRLAEHLHADPDVLQRSANAVPIAGVGPWSYASVVLERARAALLRGVVGDHVGDSWLAHLISGEHRKFLAARQATHGWQKPDPAAYPADAHRPLELGQIVGGRGDTLLLVWRHAEGVARIAAVAPDSFTLLGNDVLDFLRRQLHALGVAVDDIPGGPAVGPGSRHAPRLLHADYDTPPAPTAINRIGGRAIGVGEWPTHASAPMHHVLTLDLNDHPDFQPPGVRALALFISSPSSHEAYQPHTPHTRVLLLSDADLARGETPLPDDLDTSDTIRPATLTLTSGAGLTDRELYQHSFAGGSPQWLQGDESEGLFGDHGDDDYADDDNDDNDEESEPRHRPPRDFVLQFDGALISDVNLGDLGIMYVFAETAWFQCH